ncbi:E3 ubiquitin-protein ligase At1g12760 isoform X1 [Nicotiana tabacum]|uniref:RING-type E3 ubiquitin transferase n=1 Tax=Nicotiana tabacum TaxID=4097 RepID=A0A1S3ZKJ6_TOBAC|nr:PREDICTED: E3 ubiquitin-protein ligase At1g12760-like isoform X1 [Nicotiana tabacum]
MFSASSSNSPLLRSNENDESFHLRSPRRHSLREAIRVFQRASNRSGLMMREPSDQQVNDRQSNWAYSKPVVIIDLLWNFAYIIVACFVLFFSREEDPEMPLRIWIVGYSLLCVLHIVCVFLEYRRRGYGQSDEASFGSSAEGSSGSSGYVTLAELTPERSRFYSNMAKYMDSANTMLSFLWWIIGFYWVCIGGQRMVQKSPQLYWLCIVFLAFDVFFVVFLITLACAVGLGICCCLPCIIAVLYAVADQKGADKEDIEQLSKYIFRQNGCSDNRTGEIQGTFAGFMTQCGTDTPIEHSLSTDDAACSICLSTYDDGEELRELPCGHHFHCACIDKWLYMSATCPLCKRSIVGASCCSEEV